jgi:hypothetical protein
VKPLRSASDASRSASTGRLAHRRRAGGTSVSSALAVTSSAILAQSSSDHPAAISVSSDADAMQIAHASPANASSVIRLPSVRPSILMRSPQSGLDTSRESDGQASARRFRGRRKCSRTTPS